MNQTAHSTMQGARQGVQNVLGSLLRAIKNHSLYPEGHDKLSKAVGRVYEDLNGYLKDHKVLSFEIGKDRLVFQGETIYSAPAEQGNLPFIFFRDGIQTLEFSEGIEETELEAFFGILDRHWILADEPEGDLVTALWDAQLPHIRYVVSDVFWGSESEMDLGAFSIGKNLKSGTADSEGTVGDPGPVDAVPDPFDRGQGTGADAKRSTFGSDVNLPEWMNPIEPEAVELKPEESELLFSWVTQEEKKESLNDFLNALFDSLLEIHETKDFEVVLDTFKSVFQGLIERGEWDTASTLLNEVGEADRRNPDLPPEHQALTEAFFKQVSSSPVLDALEKRLLEAPQQQLKSIKKMLLLLTPDAIPTLCGLITPNMDFGLRQMITEVIEALASRDFRPLEAMLESAEATRIQRLVSILGRLHDSKIDTILEDLLRHPYPAVRREAVTALLRRDAENISKVFPLIEDEDEAIRRLILGFMVRFRKTVFEDLMLRYLKTDSPMQADHAHVLACFKALGFCGSSRSIPFLDQILTKQKWTDLFRKKSRFQGAILALKAIGTQEARESLEKAGRSRILGIRRAVAEALKDRTVQ